MATTFAPTETLESILHSLGTNPTVAKTIVAASKIGRLKDDRIPVRVSVVRNVTLEPGLPATLTVQAAAAGFALSVQMGEFDNAQREVVEQQSPIFVDEPDVVVVAMQLQTLAPRLALEFSSLNADAAAALASSAVSRVASIVAGIRNRASALILVHNFELSFAPSYGILDAQRPTGQQATIREANRRLVEAIGHVSNAYVIDVEHLMAQLGYEQALDERYWHIGRAPYTFRFQQRLAAEYTKFLRPLRGKSKKCLVLDCDNTLWGGIVGEDGLGGIKLGMTNPGSAFREFHAAILELYNRGILLALNSKNNVEDVVEVLARHPDSLLREDHFVVKKVNWQDKASNLREIAFELNIGLDSLVFIDDNPFECQFVREQLPEVEVVELSPDPTRYARMLRMLPYFETLTLSDEDQRRSEMYQAERRRSDLKQSSGSLEDYLRSLEMRLSIAEADDFSIPRIAQLTQKTNQFNTTTRRYSEEEIAAFVRDDNWRVFYAKLSDTFDDAGIIAVAIVKLTADDARFDTLLMSCRVIGRGVEEAFVGFLSAAIGKTRRTLIGEYEPTGKNALVAGLFEKLGFIEREGSNRRWWEHDLRAKPLEIPDWFEIIGGLR